MNLLFLCNEYPPYSAGGIGVFTKELSEELVKDNKNKVYIVGVYPNSNKSVSIENNVTVIRLPKRSGYLGDFINRYRIYKELNELIDVLNIDILEVQDFGGPLAFYGKLKCKVIVRLHGSVFYFKSLTKDVKLKDYIWRIFEKLTFNNADNIVSVSCFTKNKTMELYNINKKIDVIYNGVIINKKHKSHYFSMERKYVFAGSILRKKGIFELINAWVSFSKNKKNISLDVYGKDLEKNIEKLKKILKLNNIDNVKFKGCVNKNELMLKYEDVDFCVFPSKAEAFSLAPMEAMALSKVVLYSNQTSASELIKDKYNGILIKSCSTCDILESLEYSYKLTLDDYNKISKNAFNEINANFNVINKIDDNVAFYNDVLGINHD